MIYVLTGANTYQADHGLRALLTGLAKKYPGVTPERIDATELEPSRLPDVLQGASLFSEHRIIVLRSPSANKTLWTALEGYVDKVSDDIELIIIDPALDKRTKTYKALHKNAQVREYAEFGPRNLSALQSWVADEAKRQGLDLPSESVSLLIERVGYEQWLLASAITTLALLEDGSPERIRAIIEPSPSANAFELFEQALKGHADTVNAMLNDLQLTNDPHMLVGLLGSQCYQLALLAHSNKTPSELAKLLGSSPYPLQKLSPIARSLTKVKVRRAVDAITECDRDLKRSVAPPWTLIARALLKIATA